MALRDNELYLGLLKELLQIDSPVGYTYNISFFVYEKLKEMGYNPTITKKGDVIVCINPDIITEENSLLVEAHLDTIGGMVSHINEKGRLEISPLGALSPNNTEAENVKVITRNKKIFEGTFQIKNASRHVDPIIEKKIRSFENMEVVLDEDVFSKQDTVDLGIRIGDIVAFDPRTRFLENGYIKSRFLDDKLCVAILLYLAYYLKNKCIQIKRRLYLCFTVYEEVGHGGSSVQYPDISEILSLDMGVVGDNINCNEHKVSIGVKDSRGPYSYEMVSRLIELAKIENLDYELDVYPNYSSDADAAMFAGVCARHALIGPGVYASHGYERSHMNGVINTFYLLLKYVQQY